MTSCYNMLWFSCKTQCTFCFFWTLISNKIKTVSHEISYSVVYFKILVVVISDLCETPSRIKSHKLEALVDLWFSPLGSWRDTPLWGVPQGWLRVEHGAPDHPQLLFLSTRAPLVTSIFHCGFHLWNRFFCLIKQLNQIISLTTDKVMEASIWRLHEKQTCIFSRWCFTKCVLKSHCPHRLMRLADVFSALMLSNRKIGARKTPIG